MEEETTWDEADTGLTHPLADECQEPPKAIGSSESSLGQILSCSLQKESALLMPWLQTPGLQSYDRKTCLSFQGPEFAVIGYDHPRKLESISAASSSRAQPSLWAPAGLLLGAGTDGPALSTEPFRGKPQCAMDVDIRGQDAGASAHQGNQLGWVQPSPIQRGKQN